MESKFEGIVFAKDEEYAIDQVYNLMSGLPIAVEGTPSVIGGNPEKTLDQIYLERPELQGKSPEQGFIYNEFKHRNSFRKYVGK